MNLLRANAYPAGAIETAMMRAERTPPNEKQAKSTTTHQVLRLPFYSEQFETEYQRHHQKVTSPYQNCLPEWTQRQE